SSRRDCTARYMTSSPALPDRRGPAAMKHGKDLDPVLVRSVEHAVRKPAHNPFTDVREHYLMHQGVDRDSVEHLLHFGNKFRAEACPFGVVPIECLVELSFGLIPQYNWQVHCRALARARALMTSHGVTASGRAMLSDKRRSNSARWAVESGATS